MKLSKYLELSEAIKSDTAIRLGLKNYPSPEEMKNLEALAVNIIDRLNNETQLTFGYHSIFRSESLNIAVGGSTTSQHCKGEAADLDCEIFGKNEDNAHMFKYIRDNLDFDQLIWEHGNDVAPDWVHVSYKRIGKNRKQVLRCYREKGRTVYKPCKDKK